MAQQDPSAQSGGDSNPYGQPISQPPPPGYYPPPTQPPAQPPASGQYPPAASGYHTYAPQPAQPLSPADERMWGMLAYLLAIVGGFIAPLIIYFVYRDRSDFVRETSREALNLMITAAIISVGSMFVFFFAMIMSAAVPPLGIVMFMAWLVILVGYSIAVLVFEILGAMRANEGKVYRVPFILRLVK